MKKDIGLLALRLSFGLTMLFAHGWPKLMKFSVISKKFPDPIGLGSEFSLALAVFAEVFCAFFLAIGLKTKWVSVPLAITMIVAAFVIHADDPWGKKEMAFMYFSAYVALFFTGAGSLSVDRFIDSKK